MAAGIPWPSRQFFPMARGRLIHLGSSAIGVARLPTDSIGNYTLTLTNIAVGSAVQIETLAGVLVEYRVADDATEVFTVPAYASGNPANDLLIKVRKGSAAPYYRPYETQATAQIGAASIFVSQIPE